MREEPSSRASKLRALAAGIRSYVPLARTYRGTGGSTSARYCYTVWFRHLAALAESGVELQLDSVAELGPGDSLGVGLSALLSGAGQVTCLDVIEHDDPARDSRVLDELAALFEARAPVPGNDEFPGVLPAVPAAPFPSELIARVRRSAERAAPSLDTVREAIGRRGDRPLRYVCPWDSRSVPAASVDLVFSQAVLQDIAHDPGGDVLDATFAAMAGWLKPGAVMSHQIDLGAPIGTVWNDHWTFGDAAWRLTRGRRPYYFNRVPLSEYLSLCARHGFDVLRVVGRTESRRRGREAVAPRFHALPDGDFNTSSVQLVARRR